MLVSTGATIRDLMVDCLGYWNIIKNLETGKSLKKDEVSTLRAYWLVHLYGVFEKSLNTIASDTISHVASTNTNYIDLNSEIVGLFNYSGFQSIKDCRYERVFDHIAPVVRTLRSSTPATLAHNPIMALLQNVDAESIEFITRLLGIRGHTISPKSRGMLENLKERRNAVAHGREKPVDVGDRFNQQTLKDMYDVVDLELSTLLTACEQYCRNNEYLH